MIILIWPDPVHHIKTNFKFKQTSDNNADRVLQRMNQLRAGSLIPSVHVLHRWEYQPYVSRFRGVCYYFITVPGYVCIHDVSMSRVVCFVDGWNSPLTINEAFTENKSMKAAETSGIQVSCLCLWGRTA